MPQTIQKNKLQISWESNYKNETVKTQKEAQVNSFITWVKGMVT